MLSDEQGVQAIIDLQAKVGIEETKESAKAGWDKLSDFEKETTERAHIFVCGGFKEKSE